MLSGWTKILLKALGCWRWDVGEKGREQMLPHVILEYVSDK